MKMKLMSVVIITLFIGSVSQAKDRKPNQTGNFGKTFSNTKPIENIDQCVAKAYAAAKAVAMLEPSVDSVEVEDDSTIFLASTQTSFNVNLELTKQDKTKKKISYLVKTVDIELTLKPKAMEYCTIDSINRIR